LICITDTCILHLVRLLRFVQQQRTSLVFRTQHYCKELETYTQMLMFLVQRCVRAHLLIAVDISIRLIVGYVQTRAVDAELFPSNEEELKQSMSMMRVIDRLDKSCFYGRALGFQVRLSA
jgi:hypothetical protein